MKSLDQIYESILSKFKSKTNLDVAKGSVIDNYTVSVSSALEEAYKEIENNKNPHIFTKLEGDYIDKMGLLVGCARQGGESDESYLYRMLSWNTSNQAANTTSIETALMNMTYASNVTYVPYTQGVGTATAYIIPKSLDSETQEKAIQETKDKLLPVLSAGSYVEYIVPKTIPVNIVAYLSVYKDEENVKKNIQNKIQDYINNIAPGDKLEIGQLNKIGISETNVGYFSVSIVKLGSDEMQDISATQKLEEKFVFNEIIWNMVVND